MEPHQAENLDKKEAIEQILNLVNTDKYTGCDSCAIHEKVFKEAIETHKLVRVEITVSCDELGRYAIHLDGVKKFYPKQKP